MNRVSAVDLRAVPKDVHFLCGKLRAAGKRAWIVGGCVRDLLLGRDVNDWDVCTDAKPEEMLKIFPRAIPTGMWTSPNGVLVPNAMTSF